MTEYTRSEQKDHTFSYKRGVIMNLICKLINHKIAIGLNKDIKTGKSHPIKYCKRCGEIFAVKTNDYPKY